MSAQARLKRLEELLLEQKAEGSLSVEALLDLLLCFYTEVSQSPLKREKHVTDFLDWGRFLSPALGPALGPGLLSGPFRGSCGATRYPPRLQGGSGGLQSASTVLTRVFGRFGGL